MTAAAASRGPPPVAMNGNHAVTDRARCCRRRSRIQGCTFRCFMLEFHATVLPRASILERGCRGVWGTTSPSGLRRAYPIGRPAVGCGVVLPVCPCVASFSKFREPDTRATCCGHRREDPREHVTGMLRGDGSRGIPALCGSVSATTATIHTVRAIKPDDAPDDNALVVRIVVVRE